MYWVIGDIHGFYDPLKILISAIEAYHASDWRPAESKLDRLIFLGDYIDYGFCSREVIDFILSLKYDKVLLMGNHDDMLLQFVNHGHYFQQYGNVWFRGTGGQTTVNSLTRGRKVKLRDRDSNYDKFNHTDFKMTKKHRQFFESLRYNYQEEINGQNFIFIHGGLDPDKSMDQQLQPQTYEEFHNFIVDQEIWIENSTLWLKKEPLRKFGHSIVIHGHMPTFAIDHYYQYLHGYKLDSYFPFCKFEETGDEQAVFDWDEYENPYKWFSFKNLIAIDIDTGSIYGKKLTALGLPNRECEGMVNEMVVVQVDTGSGFRDFDRVYRYRELKLQP